MASILPVGVSPRKKALLETISLERGFTIRDPAGLGRGADKKSALQSRGGKKAAGIFDLAFKYFLKL